MPEARLARTRAAYTFQERSGRALAERFRDTRVGISMRLIRQFDIEREEALRRDSDAIRLLRNRLATQGCATRGYHRFNILALFCVDCGVSEEDARNDIRATRPPA